MCDNGQVLPVKTNRPIPKGKIFECMEIINKHTCKLPISVGEVIIADVFGADIVATKNME
jgi:CxxC motif-containing protein